MKPLAIAFALSFLSVPALASERPAPSSSVGIERRLGEGVPLGLAFHDAQGRSVAIGSLVGHGEPALLVLAYSRCAMLCNLVLRHVADTVAHSELEPGRDFRLLTVSIDPQERESQAALTQQAALARAGYEGQLWRWPFLIGEKPTIDRLARSVGFHYRWDPRTAQYDHPAAVVVLSERAEVLGYLEGLSWSRRDLFDALRGSSPATVDAAGILRCFRPELSTNKYAAWIQRGLRGGSALVLVALVLLVGRTRRARAA